jgi:hypothetical protein
VSHAHPIRFRLPRTEVLLAALAVAVAVDVALFAYADHPGGPLNPMLDHVSSVTWTSGSTTLSSGSGFEAHPGSHIALTLTDTNCLVGCPTIDFTSAQLTPSSFTVVNASLPEIAPGTTGNFTVTVATPGEVYSGPLSIELT